MPASQRAKPPSQVREISMFLGFVSALFILVALMSLAACFLEPGAARATLACGGIAFLGLGGGLGVLAIGFHRLRPWAYSPVKVLAGSWWGFGIAITLGLKSKINDPQVRNAFGLPPIGDTRERPHS